MPVRVQDYDVVSRLTQLRAPKDVLLDVIDRAAGERANVTASDPSGTAGTEMRRWATRYLRDDPEMRRLGWVPCSHSQVDGIRNDDLKMKVAFMNTDARTGMIGKTPHSVSEKGSLSERFIKNNNLAAQGKLFDDLDSIDPIAQYDFWYLCAYISQRHMAAELSRPTELVSGFVTGYSERVILWQPGDKSGLVSAAPVPEDFAEIDLPVLKRK